MGKGYKQLRKLGERGANEKSLCNTQWAISLFLTHWLRPWIPLCRRSHRLFLPRVKDSQEPLAKTHFVAEGEVSFKSILFIPTSAPHGMFQDYGQKKTDFIKVGVCLPLHCMPPSTVTWLASCVERMHARLLYSFAHVFPPHLANLRWCAHPGPKSPADQPAASDCRWRRLVRFLLLLRRKQTTARKGPLRDIPYYCCCMPELLPACMCLCFIWPALVWLAQGFQRRDSTHPLHCRGGSVVQKRPLRSRSCAEGNVRYAW